LKLLIWHTMTVILNLRKYAYFKELFHIKVNLKLSRTIQVRRFIPYTPNLTRKTLNSTILLNIRMWEKSWTASQRWRNNQKTIKIWCQKSNKLVNLSRKRLWMTLTKLIMRYIKMKMNINASRQLKSSGKNSMQLKIWGTYSQIQFRMRLILKLRKYQIT
jgi:hypothetical protein